MGGGAAGGGGGGGGGGGVGGGGGWGDWVPSYIMHVARACRPMKI